MCVKWVHLRENEMTTPKEEVSEGDGDSEGLLSRALPRARGGCCWTTCNFCGDHCSVAAAVSLLLCLVVLACLPLPCTHADLPAAANVSGAPSPWDTYVTALYGNDSRVVDDPGALTMFYAGLLRRAGLHLGVSRDASCACSVQNGTITSRGRSSFDPPDTLWRWNGDRTPRPNHSRVEVTHCKAAAEHDRERHGAWFYLTPGSGVVLDTGRTRAFDTHQAAVRALVNETLSCYECADHFYDLVRNARAAGLDSLQFVHHTDQRCGNMAIELLQVHGNGNAACANVTLWKADGTPCECDNALRCASCAPVPPPGA